MHELVDRLEVVGVTAAKMSACVVQSRERRLTLDELVALLKEERVKEQPVAYPHRVVVEIAITAEATIVAMLFADQIVSDIEVESVLRSANIPASAVLRVENANRDSMNAGVVSAVAYSLEELFPQIKIETWNPVVQAYQ